MLQRLANVVLLAIALGGLCLPVRANTTMANAAAAPAASGPMLLAQSDITIFPGVTIPSGEQAALAAPVVPITIALLVPLRSDALGAAADAVRSGFLAAHERERDGIAVTVVETGEAAQDVLSGYVDAVAQHDMVVGPMTRSAVAAVAQSGQVRKPTIALTQPEAAGAELKLPRQMLVIGLSIEDESRQVAHWAAAGRKTGKAMIVSSNIAWQQRAADAFAEQWEKGARELEAIELPTHSGYLAEHDLAQLKTQLEFEKPDLIFAALDERQAKQLRAAIGHEIPVYGTSQLNPFAQSDRSSVERATEMDGVRLLDIPWQLEPDHPAVMVYPRPAAKPDQRGSADIERLYALGIDAYRVAREIALNHRSRFELDGVTGKLKVRFDTPTPFFERTEQQAIYRDGVVVAVKGAR